MHLCLPTTCGRGEARGIILAAQSSEELKKVFGVLYQERHLTFYDISIGVARVAVQPVNVNANINTVLGSQSDWIVRKLERPQRERGGVFVYADGYIDILICCEPFLVRLAGDTV